jgi:hypothetical protein
VNGHGRLLLGLLVGGILVWAALLAYAWVTNREAVDRNETALAALCAQRADLDVRIDRTISLLQEFPGPLVFGIPREYVTDGLRQNQVTRKNLNILDCQEAP